MSSQSVINTAFSAKARLAKRRGFDHSTAPPTPRQNTAAIRVTVGIGLWGADDARRIYSSTRSRRTHAQRFDGIDEQAGEVHRFGRDASPRANARNDKAIVIP